MKRAAILLILLAGCQTATPTAGTTPPTFTAEAVRVTGLPPGALNPAVTQATIRTTICVAGWTATVRPPVSYTSKLKAAQMKTRHLTGPASALEEDHLIPLELGGAPRDPLNLWPEPRTGPRNAGDKDRLENSLHRDVCAGTVTLADAQHKITDPTNWGQM